MVHETTEPTRECSDFFTSDIFDEHLLIYELCYIMYRVARQLDLVNVPIICFHKCKANVKQT